MFRSFVRTTTRLSRRFHALSFAETGDPLTVLSYIKTDLDTAKLGDDQIRVQILAAPINPADINTVEGKYPLKPPPEIESPQTIPGHEGVGRVIEVGSGVSTLKDGDIVVPLASHQGTWSEGGIYKAQYWHKVPNDIPIEMAAMLTINPPTAICLLQDFVDLKEGDTIVQSAATSIVGQAVIQLAKLKGIQTVNIIRGRPDTDLTKEELISLGATLVGTEDTIRHNFEEMYAEGKIGRGVLGLDAIGGQHSSLVAKFLKSRSTLVVYGGMSKEPTLIPASDLIFKDLTIKGFWWSGRTSLSLGLTKKAALIDQIVQHVQNGNLKFNTESIPLKDYKEALLRHNKPYKKHKILLVP